MKIKHSILTTSILFVSLLAIFSSFSIVVPSWNNDFKKINYQIQSTSLLEVNGKTNINSFCCTSNERFQNQRLDYMSVANSASFYFRNTKFDIKIEQLDCGKKKINNDLFKALKVADYPNITIDLKEVINTECKDLSECGEWVEFEANTDVTITCETNPIMIPIMVKRLDNNSFRITGGTTLQLCDFDIKAPTALMGLIKVKDEIDFNFDLFVDINTH